MRLSFYISVLPVFILAFIQSGCSIEAGKELSHLHALDEIDRFQLHEGIKVGPEFEFDVPNKSESYNSIEALHYIGKVKQDIISRLGQISIHTQAQMSQILFEFAPQFAEETGFDRAIFRMDGGENRLMAVADLRYVGKVDYFSVELFPANSNNQFKSPFAISYTKDDVLFEVKVSPLTINQLDYSQRVLDFFIFESMRDSGLIVPPNGGGHLHLGLDSLFQAFDNDYKLASTAIYNFLRVIYESDRFVHSFMRPHENFAILPSMVSDVGRHAVDNAFSKWKSSIENFPSLSRSQYLSWLDNHLQDATLLHFLDEVQNHKTFTELTYFFDEDFGENDRSHFRVKPDSDSALYPGIRFNRRIRTLEIRALSSQNNINEFLEISRFFTRFLVGASYLELEDLTLKSEAIYYGEKVPLSYVRDEFSNLMAISGYGNSSEEVTKFLRAIHPKVEINCP